MAPGLCYLAVNGGEFLAFANDLLNKKRQQNGNTVTEADLPVDGNASQVISRNVEEDIFSAFKPFWWYIAGFPIWCRIASVGRTNMIDRISKEGEPSASPQDVNEDDILLTNGKEFCIAIFFVIFGVISVIAGVGSNIFAQLSA